MKNLEWCWIPKYVHPDVAGVTFGGFMVGRYICSQPNAFNAANGDKPDVADGTAPGNVPAFSVAGKPSWRYISYWNARIAAANANTIDGPGVHLLTAFEWASLAMLSHKFGILPHGNNANVNPPADATYTSEIALVDQAAIARNATYYASLTGTGPTTWNLLHHPHGPADLNGNMWEWVLGLHMQTADEAGHAGHALVLASLDVSLAASPYGRSTSVGATTLTDTDKTWTVNYFTAGGGAGATCYLIDAAGTRFTIASNTANTITVSSGNPATGPYEIVMDIATDITAGMLTGNRILTLRNADANLKGFAIPATSDGLGATAYGTDGYWFNTADPGTAPNNIRTALRGGDWSGGSSAGVFALLLSNVPLLVDSGVGFRLGKAL
mgnify:CR=1 FL=1